MVIRLSIVLSLIFSILVSIVYFLSREEVAFVAHATSWYLFLDCPSQDRFISFSRPHSLSIRNSYIRKEYRLPFGRRWIIIYSFPIIRYGINYRRRGYLRPQFVRIC